VIDRARAILSRLEGEDASITLPGPSAKPRRKITVVRPEDDAQLNLL
jgi:DNA mismatch repair protein MutS